MNSIYGLNYLLYLKPKKLSRITKYFFQQTKGKTILRTEHFY